MKVAIHYRLAGRREPQTLEVWAGDEHYARALWLSHAAPGGIRIDCTVTEIPPEARVGEGQDPEPYRSPVYDHEPTAGELLDDEERRLRFVEQGRRVAEDLAGRGPVERAPRRCAA